MFEDRWILKAPPNLILSTFFHIRIAYMIRIPAERFAHRTRRDPNPAPRHITTLFRNLVVQQRAQAHSYRSIK